MGSVLSGSSHSLGSKKLAGEGSGSQDRGGPGLMVLCWACRLPIPITRVTFSWGKQVIRVLCFAHFIRAFGSRHNTAVLRVCLGFPSRVCHAGSVCRVWPHRSQQNSDLLTPDVRRLFVLPFGTGIPTLKLMYCLEPGAFGTCLS